MRPPTPTAEPLRRVQTAALLRGQQTLTPLARSALKLIARYPLLAPRDLAALLGVPRPKVSAPLRALMALDLIVARDGLCVAPSGLGLLAGWLRVPVRALARYAPWGLRQIGAGYGASLPGLLRLRAHNRLVARFAAGLRESGAALVVWDQPLEGEGPDPLRATRRGRVVPDAIGGLRLGARRHVFWLEVDRDTMQGGRLRAKLARYYALAYAWRGRREAPQLLFLVDGGEARLQELRRKVRALDARFGFRLPVRFARVDQLRVGRSGALAPWRAVWRAADRAEALGPFAGEDHDHAPF